MVLPNMKERLKKAEQLRKKPEGPFRIVPPDEGPKRPPWMNRVYRNNRYIVMIDDHKQTTHGEAICAMVQTVSGRPIENHWSEMQRIKNEIFGPDTLGIEYYPKQHNLIDQANIYWLWIFPDGTIPTMINKSKIRRK